jgi:hypothetical protein
MGFPGGRAGLADLTTEFVMSAPVFRRSVGFGKFMMFAALAIAWSISRPATSIAAAGNWHIDPAQVVPLEQLAPESRGVVAEVIREHTFHRQGEAETFLCHSNLYLRLVNEPLLPLTLWKDLSDSRVQLQKVGPNRYQGSDGSGSTAIWDYVLRTPRMHVLVAYFNYVSPHGSARIDARIVLIVHSNYYRDNNDGSVVQQDVEAFVKVDSMGWKAVARTLRPLLERVLEDQVREAGFFISLMSRLINEYPNWACQVINGQSAIDANTKQGFLQIVVQTRKPGASAGRPTVVQNSAAAQNIRRR